METNLAAEQIPPSSVEVLAHSGWIATAIVSLIAWAGKMALGRHFKSLDELSTKFDTMNTAITSVDKRLSKLEGRFEQQDHERD